MIKLTWQMTVLYAIGMAIMGAVVICGFFVDTNGMDRVAFSVLALMLGYGGGKAQTIWEIRKANNVRQQLSTERDGRADDPPTG